MTFYYQTRTWNSQPQISEETINLWKHLAEKKNWRITETIEGAEAAIDGSVEHYAKKIDFLKGPKVVKTFK